ncbi:LPS export ABC transporter permease LptF [Alkalilimnicola sp. S0819]|uniref:LPS export ABC transporter permease LptF n=1 Tax=Alkalilimnicola sp. S0819 TaxID=2613922 RepID=UPI0012623F7C|nr:LPS export ABC transporter permease LptF [Alkalilimnicola sp. S0819]KAB7628339.1 LPS export ABC transporter permease LptF [Alkalilimnicola sp. S0819]MPQ15238.1 LPS export ABC transporter permease LptF [Alkalilimnicola sp. S0819]
MRLSIVARYLIREVVQAWLAVTLVLVAVLLTNRLVRFLAEAASGEIPGDVVLALLGYKALSHLGLVLPASFFLGVVLAFGRLYRDTEMAALGACGIGPRRLYQALLLLAVPLAGVVGLMALQLGPWADRAGEQLQLEAQQRVDVAGLRAGRFLQIQDLSGTFYLERFSADGSRMEDVFVQTRGEGGELVLIAAARGRQEIHPETRDRHLVLEDGYRYQGVPGSPQWRVVRFERHGVLIREAEVGEARLRHGGMPTEVLLASDAPRLRAELQRRLSAPLMVFVLALLAVPLSRSSPRDGRYGRLLAAVLVYAIYSNLLTVAQGWMEDGDLPVALGLWWVHGLLAALGLILLWREYGLRRRPRAVEAGA